MAEDEAQSSVEKIEPGTVMLLLRRAVEERFAGRIIFRKGQQSCSFFFRDGFIINAKTNSAEYRLGEVLKASFGLDDRTISVALKLSKIKEQPLGMVLLGQKRIQPKDLYQCLVAQVELILGNVLTWDSGICYINQGVAPGKGIVLLRVSAAGLLGLASRAAEPAARTLPPPEPAVSVPVADELPRALEDLIGEVMPGPPKPPSEPSSFAESPPPPAAPPRPGPPPAAEEGSDEAASPAAQPSALRSDEEHILAFLRERESVAADDHYGLLGVKPSAGEEDIRKAYQLLVRSFHPDRVSARLLERDLARLQGVFARLNAAWGVLGDSERRKAYDREQRAAVSGRTSQTAVSPEEDAEHLYRSAISFIKSGEHNHAVEYLKKACQLNPRQAKYYYYLGGSYFKTRRLKQAEEALLKAIDLEGSSPDYYVALGQIYRAGRMFTRAADMFSRALKWEPRHPQALKEKRELERLKREEG